MIEVREKISKGSQAGFPGVLAQGRYVLGDITVSRREAIGNCKELEGREAVERVGASSLEEALVVIFCVNKSDMEAFVVEEFG